MFLFVETKVGHGGPGLGVGTPCVFSGVPLFSESSREYTERKSIHELKGSGPLPGQPKITMEWCGHKENANMMDLSRPNIFKLTCTFREDRDLAFDTFSLEGSIICLAFSPIIPFMGCG